MSRQSKQDHPQPEDLVPDADARHAPNVPEGRRKQMDEEQGGGVGGGDKKDTSSHTGSRDGSDKR